MIITHDMIVFICIAFVALAGLISYIFEYKTKVVDGKVHCTNGPAVTVRGSNHREWYIDGRPLPKEEVESWLEENNIDLNTEEGEMAFILRWT